MNKEKYYTPEIEEFHVGFEFEFKSGNVEWKPFIFNPPKLDAVISNLGSKPDMFRVKHLDRKDIESLEFEYKGWNHVSYDYYKGDSKENTCISVFKDNSVSIQKRVEGLLESDINNIVIKNKSELKRILKQIGV